MRMPGVPSDDALVHNRRVAELRVIDVLPDSEAARNSVCVGDTLVAVDKKSCQQRSKEEMLGTSIFVRCLCSVSDKASSDWMSTVAQLWILVHTGMISGQVGSVVRLDLRRNAGRHAGVGK